MDEIRPDPWRVMCDLADMNALNIVSGTWDAVDEHALVSSMVLAGREELGATGIRVIHDIRLKVSRDPEWKDAHFAARTFYDGAIHAIEVRLEALLESIMGAPQEAGELLAQHAMAVVDQLGACEAVSYRLLNQFFAALNARHMHRGARLVAWRMLRLERVFSRRHSSKRTPLLQWLRFTASTEDDHLAVIGELERLAVAALEREDPYWLIEAVFDQQIVLDVPFRTELQELVDARLQGLWSDDAALNAELDVERIRAEVHE
jgi:hypothetical protein